MRKVAGVGLHTVDWNQRDVGEFVRAMQQEFMYRGTYPSRGEMVALLDFLDSIVLRARALNMASWAAQSTWFPFSAFVDKPGYELTKADIDKWNNRSSDYREKIEGASSGKAIFDDVTAPLITGYYPDGRDSFPDAATPVVIAHMAQVSTAAMADAIKQYYKDAATEAKGVFDKAKEGAAGATSNAFAFLDWILEPGKRHRLLLVPLTAGGVGTVYVAAPRLALAAVSKFTKG